MNFNIEVINNKEYISLENVLSSTKRYRDKIRDLEEENKNMVIKKVDLFFLRFVKKTYLNLKNISLTVFFMINMQIINLKIKNKGEKLWILNHSQPY